jgi:hemolysin III
MDQRHRREEWWNSVTHGFGLAASVTATTLLIVFGAFGGDPWLIVGVSVFGTTLVLLYAASTLYHAVGSPRAKGWLRSLDHGAIFLLIAGTYTPFVLVPLRGGWGWSLFGVVWGFAVVGVVFKLFAAERFPRISTGVYIALGWVVVVAIVPLVRRVPTATLGWLLAGGLAYTAGTIFYASRRVPYGHAIWHLFVLGGSACHAMAVATLLGTTVR